MPLFDRGGFVEDRVERSVLLFVFLDEAQVLAVFVEHPRDSERGQQAEFENTLAGYQGFEGNFGLAGKMGVFADDRLDYVFPCDKKPTVFERVRGLRFQFGIEMLQIPDAIVQSRSTAID